MSIRPQKIAGNRKKEKAYELKKRERGGDKLGGLF
jgi:hypothetical protein